MKIWTKPELQIYDLDLLTKKVISAAASGGSCICGCHFVPTDPPW